jgi:queuine tRNA-ribosyltransferase
MRGMTGVDNKYLGFVPSLTSMAGSCLTAKNWFETGIKAASFDLASLLIKPGYSLLCSLNRLQHYLGWEKPVVLDASLLQNKEEQYKIRSTYDGSIIEHSHSEIWSLIETLNPEFVLLPPDVRTEEIQFNSKITPLFANTTEHSGVYVRYSTRQTWEEFIEDIKQYPSPYVIGDFTQEQIAELITYNIRGVQSDRPAEDGMLGNVYTINGNLDLRDKRYEMDFARMDQACECLTCTQGFTRAYLHHLLAQTPLLCQRLLIQHNIHHSQSFTWR